MERQLSSSQKYSGRVVSLRVDNVEKPGGTTTTREVVEHGDCIAVVPVDQDGNVLLVQQFRYPVGCSLLEVPAGGIDAGEDAIDSVKRELQEEIGYVPATIEKLGGFYSAPGYSTEYLYTYLATDLSPSRLVAEDTDEIEVLRVPLPDIPALIYSGQICDSKSVAALLFYLTRERLLG